MFGQFRRKRGPKIDLSKYKQGSLATASFEQILEAFQTMPPAVSPGVLIDATQRLIELAYEDASLSDEEREQAARLADGVIQDTEKAFEGDASRLSAYRAAYQHQLESAKKFGVGSLAQRILDLPSDKVISEIIKIENASELANLSGQVGDDGVERITTQLLFDILEVPQRSRGVGACRRLAKLMAELGWTAVRVRGLTRGGYLEQVRGYCREPLRRA